MVRFLIGDQIKKDYFIYRKKFGTLDHSDLDLAITNLEQSFATPGITELFDQSLLLMQETLGLRSIQYLRVNESTIKKMIERSGMIDWTPMLNWTKDCITIVWKSTKTLGKNL